MKFLPTVAVMAFLGAAGCTAHNPDYTGGGGGGGGAGGDLAGVTVDLAGVVLDLSGPMGSCTGDERKCAGGAASDRCEGGVFVVDRECPNASTCTNDYCAPPTPMFGTQLGMRCDAQGAATQAACIADRAAMLTCQPFVDPSAHKIRWFCDKAVGAGAGGASCTAGSECMSGVCTVGGVCLQTCNSDGDCRLVSPSSTQTCKSFSITVEGVTVTQKGCA